MNNVIICHHRPGDIGWVIGLHGDLYYREYGWDISFEQLVAEIGAKFLKDFKPGRECCLIAEMNGDRAGSAFIVEESASVAKLRLVILDPKARGHGIGKRLVGDCLQFARDAGYSQVTLWTNDILHAARAIYIAYGFRLIAEEKHHSFGQDLTGQNWLLDL